MERSKLENVGNTQLYFVLKRVIEEYDEPIGSDSIEYSSFMDVCETSCKIVGIGSPYYIDYNYILATLLLNKGFDYSENKVSGVLKRPEVGLFSFDIDEIRVETVRTTYTHEISSYNKSLVFPTVQSMQNDGGFEYYDGTESDKDYLDGETTDINYDHRSLRQIK
jgi:hypothetical protein